MTSIATGIAADIEKSEKTKEIFKIKIPRSLADINLQLNQEAFNYITGQHKKINIGGPVFLTVEYTKK